MFTNMQTEKIKLIFKTIAHTINKLKLRLIFLEAKTKQLC